MFSPPMVPMERPRRVTRALNAANLLTYGRCAAVPAVVACFFWDGEFSANDHAARWFSLGIFTIAAITDYADGWVARTYSQATALGRMLDPIADKLLVAACLLLLAADSTIAGWSLWAAVIILCREILVSGLREFLAELRVSVPVTKLAKWKTTMQHRHRLPAGRTGGRARPAGLHDDRPRSVVVRRSPDALHRLGLFPRRRAPPLRG